MNDASAIQTTETSTVSVIRSILLGILILGMLGTGTELLLIKHTEDFKQWVPLVLILSSLCILAWYGVVGGRLSMRLFQVTMAAFIGAGLAGFYLHYQGAVEFKLESNPSLAGSALFWEAMRGKAPPPLAPGIMIQLGLIGLAYAYRHPAMSSSTSEPENKGE